MIKIHTKSRDNLYEAFGFYDEGIVTVIKGSRINNRINPKFKPPISVAVKLADRSIVDENGILRQDVQFKSLSTSATFVTGRISNGMIVWKTENGKNIRHTLNGE